MRITQRIGTVIALSAITWATPPVTAGDGSPWWVPRLRDKQVAATDTDTPATGAPANKTAAPVQTETAVPPSSTPAAATTAATTAAVATTVDAAPPVAEVPPPPPLPNSTLMKTIQRLRAGSVGQEPNSAAYLNLIEAGKASPAEVNDFAAYLAKRGAVPIALQFQQYGVTLAPKDATLWLNLGTIQRTLGNLGSSADAFQKSISLDPNNGLAHYNLGTVYDAQKNYDDAIEEYRRALVIQPDLADPRKNPQVVNNDNMLAVRLKLYSNQAGSMGLPLIQLQKPATAAKDPAPPQKTVPAKDAAPDKK
jgi:tetratricopeptide (TPR) repeat protein